jgi:hypothetical protein
MARGSISVEVVAVRADPREGGLGWGSLLLAIDLSAGASEVL